MSISFRPVEHAAGAVPFLDTASGRQVRIIHRPRYDDWALPKGHIETGELRPAAAVREVAEETSVRVRLGAPLSEKRYPVGRSMKLVSWWVGYATSWAAHTPTAEVDCAEWVSPKEALEKLTYANEREVLQEALSLPDTTPLILVRHAKARNRDTWYEADSLRPLAEKGRAQRFSIAELLAAFGVAHLLSSPATRCMQTLETFSTNTSVDIVSEPALWEGWVTVRESGDYLARLAHQVGASGTPTAVCGHLPTLPEMLAGIGVPVRPMSPGCSAVLHVDKEGNPVRSEWHDSVSVVGTNE